MELPVPQQAGPHGHTSRQWLSEGNHAFAQRAYREALRCYVVARELFPALSGSLEGNLQRCTQMLLADQTPPAQQLRLPAAAHRSCRSWCRCTGSCTPRWPA